MSRRVVMIAVTLVNILVITGIIWFLAIQYGRRPLDSERLVMGVHGRYFMPFSPLFFLSLKSVPARVEGSHKGLATTLLTFTVLSLVLTVYVLVKRYYL